MADGARPKCNRTRLFKTRHDARVTPHTLQVASAGVCDIEVGRGSDGRIPYARILSIDRHLGKSLTFMSRTPPFPIDSRAPRRCGTLKRGSMEKNVVLPQDLLTAVAEIARAEGKTPEEVIEEATRRLVRVRGLRSFVAENRRLAQEQGWTEADVPCLIDECRRESRGR